VSSPSPNIKKIVFSWNDSSVSSSKTTPEIKNVVSGGLGLKYLSLIGNVTTPAWPPENNSNVAEGCIETPYEVLLLTSLDGATITDEPDDFSSVIWKKIIEVIGALE
jgi:hypothetical protein